MMRLVSLAQHGYDIVPASRLLRTAAFTDLPLPMFSGVQLPANLVHVANSNRIRRSSKNNSGIVVPGVPGTSSASGASTTDGAGGRSGRRRKSSAALIVRHAKRDSITPFDTAKEVETFLHKEAVNKGRKLVGLKALTEDGAEEPEGGGGKRWYIDEYSDSEDSSGCLHVLDLFNEDCLVVRREAAAPEPAFHKV